jgi:hypothetical protein
LDTSIEGTAEVDDASVAKGSRGGMLKDVIAKSLKMNNGTSSNAKSELDKYLAQDSEDRTEITSLPFFAWCKVSAH